MKCYISLLLSFCFLHAFSQPKTAIDKFVKSIGNANGSIAICVRDMNNSEIVAYNQENVLTPASILKTITTATALEVLGEDYRFETVLSLDKNDSQHLIVHGYGDPTLGSEYLYDNPNSFFDIWVKEIKKKMNIQHPVNITIEDSFFGYAGVSNKWIREDLGNYYAAGTYGISIFDNTYKLFFNTMQTDTCPIILKTIPEMTDIDFFNTLTLNSTGKDNGYIYGEIFSNHRTLVGDIPRKRTSFSIKGDIPDPGMILGKTLATLLTESGFTINSIKTSRNSYYEEMFNRRKTNNIEEVPFYKHYSPTLRDIIRVVNVRSNNHYAEHLIRAIGRVKNKDIYSDALSEGIAYTKEYWKSKDINVDAFFMYDGCGLAPSNKISPASICNILIYMHNKSLFKDSFMASLPKAGQEGTVKNLLKGTTLSEKLWVKSGSISDVQCFTGYYINTNKKPFAFCIMVNNYNSPRKEIVRAIENLLLDIF